MATTIDQQVALDEALVPSTQRLRIGRSNFRLPSDIQSKESNLQVVYDVLRNSLDDRRKNFAHSNNLHSLVDTERFHEKIPSNALPHSQQHSSMGGGFCEDFTPWSCLTTNGSRGALTTLVLSSDDSEVSWKYWKYETISSSSFSHKRAHP
nr:hypothetical protein [Tanacetum cinerariifolium]